MIRGLFALAIVMTVAAGVPPSAATAQPFDDAAIIVQFQRAADTYAFTHRQTDRRGTAAAALIEGALFTPVVGAAIRNRIDTARRGGCLVIVADAVSTVPRVNTPVGAAAPVPPCIAAVLPRLPDELEYRISGVVLVLSDAHRHIVVDVLHGAFPHVED